MATESELTNPAFQVTVEPLELKAIVQALESLCQRMCKILESVTRLRQCQRDWPGNS
jgi:hypothetical protein